MKKTLFYLPIALLVFLFSGCTNKYEKEKTYAIKKELINVLVFNNQDAIPPKGIKYKYDVNLAYKIDKKEGVRDIDTLITFQLNNTKEKAIAIYFGEKDDYDKDSKVTYRFTISRQKLDDANNPVGSPETTTFPEAPKNGEFKIKDFKDAAALNSPADKEEHKRLTFQMVTFSVDNKGGGPLPIDINPPIKPVPQPQ